MKWIRKKIYNDVEWSIMRFDEKDYIKCDKMKYD